MEKLTADITRRTLEYAMKHRIISVGFMVLLVAGCTMDASFSSSGAEDSAEIRQTQYERFVTDDGLECVALGFLGLSGRGLSCNWGKFNAAAGN